MFSLEIPEFGGMQEAAFMTGHDILDSYKKLDGSQKARAFGPIVQGLSYELFSGEAELTDADAAIGALEQALVNVRKFRQIQEQRINPSEPTADLDY
jgi:hypothetical protein